MTSSRIPPRDPNVGATNNVAPTAAPRTTGAAAPAGASDGLSAPQRAELNRILAPGGGGPKAATEYLISIGHPVATAAASRDARYGTSFAEFVGSARTNYVA